MTFLKKFKEILPYGNYGRIEKRDFAVNFMEIWMDWMFYGIKGNKGNIYISLDYDITCIQENMGLKGFKSALPLP